MTTRARIGAIGLIVIACAVFWITLTPTTVDSGYWAEVQWVLNALHRIGVPEWFQYRELEFTANIVMFMPLGFFLGLLLGRGWAPGLLLLPALSVLIEGSQLYFLPGRVAAMSDVVANSTGGWIGLLVALPFVLTTLPRPAPAPVPRWE